MIVDTSFILNVIDDIEPVLAGDGHFERIPGLTHESYR